MRNIIGTIAAFALAVLVAGCASSFKSDVARFHQLPRPSGETFVVVPKDTSLRGSLEFAQYANDIASRLTAVGYRAAAPGGASDLVVTLDYGIDDGKTAIRSYPSTFRGGYYRYGHPWYSPWYDPWYMGYPGYAEPDIRSYVIYTRKLSLEIARSGNNGERLFEGRVESRGADNRLPEVMPYMVEALFKDFPGRSGVTQEIEIPYEKSSNY